MLGLKFHFRRLVSGLIVFQMAIGLTLATNPIVSSDAFAQTPPISYDGRQLDDELNIVSKAIQKSNGISVPALGAKDIGHIADWKFVTYAKQGNGEYKVSSERPLLTISADNKPVSIFEPLKELVFNYDKANQRFEINHVTHNKKTGEIILLDGQICENIEITSAPVADENGVFFASTEGLHFLPWFQVLNAYSLAPFFIPALIQTRGPKITKLTQISRNVEPEQFTIRRGDGGLVDQHKWLDLGAHFDVKGATTQDIRISREEILDNWEATNKWLLFYLQLSNPDMQKAEVIQALLAQDVIDQKNLEIHRLSLLDEESGNPKFDVTLRALAAHGQIMGKGNYIGLQDDIRNLRNAPRDVFPADASPNGKWSNDYNEIRSTEKIAQEYGLNKTWPQLLEEYYTHRSPDKLRAEYNEEAKLKASRSYRWKQSFKRWATPGHLLAAATTTVAVVGGGAYEYVNHGAEIKLAGSLMLKALEWSTRLPGVSAVTTDIYKSAPYWSSPSHWISTGIGTSLTLAFVPLSFYLAGAIAKSQGYSWDKVAALFNLGLRKYAFLDKPLQAMAQKAVGREAMYSWIDNGMNPVDYPEAMQAYNPLATKAERDHAASPANLQETFEKRQIKNTEAALLAAAFLSKASEKTETPVDIATILMSSRRENFANYSKVMLDPTKNAQWGELTIRIYKALADIGDRGIDTSNSTQINAYVSALTPIANQLRASARGSDIQSVENKKSLRERWRLAKRVTSSNVFAFLLFGKSSYEFYQKWKNAPNIDKNSAAIAKGSYVKDYVGGELIYALAAPEAFGAFLGFDNGIHFMGAQSWRILFDQGAQVFIYGFQGAVDPLSSAGEQALVNPAPAIDITPKARQMKFLEAIGAMAREYPGSSIGLFGNHASMQLNVMRDYQPRFLVDFATRYLGLIMTNFSTVGLGSALFLGAKAFALSNALLLQKMAFGFDYKSGAFIAGYATVWPIVYIANRLMRNAADKNNEAMKLASWTLAVPLRIAQERPLNEQELEMLHSGVDLMQSLYRQGNRPLPNELNISANDYTIENALQLLADASDLPPVATKASETMDTLLNIGIGSIGSVLLFNPVSKLYYDPSLTLSESYTHLLLVAAGAYIGTATVLNLALDPAETFLREKMKIRIENGTFNAASICKDMLLKLFRTSKK